MEAEEHVDGKEAPKKVGPLKFYYVRVFNSSALYKQVMLRKCTERWRSKIDIRIFVFKDLISNRFQKKLIMQNMNV